MRVFIAWSGTRSRQTAELLRGWLRKVVPGVDPFVSTEDINKGELWLTTLLQELDKASFGIVCATRDSLESKWLFFEVGALSRGVERRSICTFRVDIKPSEVPSPLSEFQGTAFNREDMLRLVRTLHSALGLKVQTPSELEEQFARCWPEFNDRMTELLAEQPGEPGRFERLSEALLLPVIYREVRSGDLDTVFHWLKVATDNGVAPPESRLGVLEASLARVTGKRGAAVSLRTQSLIDIPATQPAKLEWWFLQFAAKKSSIEVGLRPALLDRLETPIKRTAAALFGVWHLRDGRLAEAQEYLAIADPEHVSGDTHDHYRAIPMGLLCLAFGRSKAGEKFLDMAKSAHAGGHEGYPFSSMLAELDRAFVVSCIGVSNEAVPSDRIRDFRGHAWVLSAYADVLKSFEPAIENLVSLGSSWKAPLEQSAVSDRLYQFQRKVLAAGGVPIGAE